ncbi:hypothetical protein M0R45_019231 [Rubus argutus]|uniref:Uncharacterized protein n=1 Tax=Rubus argutus TaxID=59490 RepID=A0AAW1X7K6_RUBAR
MYSLKPTITDMVIKAKLSWQLQVPRGAEFASLVTAVNYGLRLFLGVEWIFILGFSFHLIVFCNSLNLSISSIILWKRLVNQGTPTEGSEVIEKTICYLVLHKHCLI